jgi:hypothetical protein
MINSSITGIFIGGIVHLVTFRVCKICTIPLSTHGQFLERTCSMFVVSLFSSGVHIQNRHYT